MPNAHTHTQSHPGLAIMHVTVCEGVRAHFVDQP